MTIGNTGDGIPKERAGLLFERFYRVCGGARARAWAGPKHRQGAGSSAWWRRRAGPFRWELDRNACAPAASCLTIEVVE